jgi:hypothetical protein
VIEHKLESRVLGQVAIALLCIIKRYAGISELQSLPQLASILRRRQRLKTKKNRLQNFSPAVALNPPSSLQW